MVFAGDGVAVEGVGTHRKAWAPTRRTPMMGSEEYESTGRIDGQS